MQRLDKTSPQIATGVERPTKPPLDESVSLIKGQKTGGASTLPPSQVHLPGSRAPSTTISAILQPATGKAAAIEKDLGKAWAQGALAAGHLQTVDTNKLKELLHFSGWSLGNTTPESRLQIREILTAFVANGGDMATAHLLKDHLKANPSVDLNALTKAFKVGHTANPRVDHAALLQDLSGGQLGTLQALAKHGLIAVKQTPLTRIATEPDQTAFAYDNLRGGQSGVSPKHIIGDEASTERLGEFFIVKRDDLEHFRGTGDKIHVSVNSKDAERAWDTIFPILLRHGETFKEFKITDMEYVGQQMQATGISTEELAKARRVYDGAQITIYQHEPKNGGKADSQAFARVVGEIERALSDAGVRPGKKPDSDVEIRGATYASFRRDKDEDGKELRPGDKDYDVYKEKMKQRPLYQALSGARSS